MFIKKKTKIEKRQNVEKINSYLCEKRNKDKTTTHIKKGSNNK